MEHSFPCQTILGACSLLVVLTSAGINPIGRVIEQANAIGTIIGINCHGYGIGIVQCHGTNGMCRVEKEGHQQKGPALEDETKEVAVRTSSSSGSLHDEEC